MPRTYPTVFLMVADDAAGRFHETIAPQGQHAVGARVRHGFVGRVEVYAMEIAAST